MGAAWTSSRLRAALTVGTALAAVAAVPGRDFVPYDWDAQGSLQIDGSDELILLDAFAAGSDTWILYGDPAAPGTLFADRYDPAAGAVGALSGSPTTVLTPDRTAGSVEAHGLNSAQLAACTTQHVSGDPLTWDGTRYRTTHIGVQRASVRVSGTGGVCDSLAVRPGSIVAGYENGGVVTTDGLALANKGSCVGFTADYDYTNCGFVGVDAYRCEMLPDPVADADRELGACRFLMVYEAAYDGDGDPLSVDDRALLTAHARDVDGVWTRYLPSGSAWPSRADVRVENTSEHAGDGAANLHSFVSVPALWYDPSAALWRMWFVTEDAGAPSIRYTESDDDGQSWGIGGGAGNTIDCWDGAAFDATACVQIDWTGTEPPDDITPPDTRSPDGLDPEVIYGNFDGFPGSELGMMFTGGDDGCASADWGVQLWQLHRDGGDQQTGSGWRWASAVAADPTDGIVVDLDGNECTSGGAVMDPEIVRYRRGYLGFFNARGGIHVAASGYACSDFADNDGAGGTDWPDDASCVNPWDISE